MNTMNPVRNVTRARVWVALVCLSTGGAPIAAAPMPAPAVRHHASTATAAAPTARSGAALANLPVHFEPNVGQAPSGTRFLVRGAAAALTDAGVTLVGGPQPVTLSFVGAAAARRMAGVGELPGKVNYLQGNDPSRWKTQVATYASVRCERMYPGIDVVYYAANRSLEYDLIVAPGADPEAVSFELVGAPSPTIDSDGTLVAGAIELKRPVAYQNIAGARRRVACRYILHGGCRTGFQIGDYDRSLPLVVDPEIGYTFNFADPGRDISLFDVAVDSSGAVYVAGRTRTTGAGGVLAIDVFVAKLNPEGTALAYSTTIGGAGADQAYAIAVDAQGAAYLTGETDSRDFPTTAGVFQPANASTGERDAFVTKLGVAGDALVYSSYHGGSGFENGRDITVDPSGNVYLVGTTTSSNFPTMAPAQARLGGSADAFVTKVNASGGARIYSTYLGGSESDNAEGIAVDAAGNTYVVGGTSSANFPATAGSFQTTFAGGVIDAFWAKYDPVGGRVAATFIGGSAVDVAHAIAVDEAETSFIAGESASADFPLVSPVQGALGGDFDAFLTRLDATGAAVGFSTVYGGSRYETGTAIAIDSAGAILVAGDTYSSDFPTVDPVQAQFGGGLSDVFVVQIDAGAAARGGGAQVQFASYFGGARRDESGGVGIGPGGEILVGVNQQAQSGGSEKDQGQVTEFILPTEPRPDLSVSAYHSALIPPDLDAVAAVTVGVQSNNCGFLDPPPVPGATFGFNIPSQLAFRRVTGMSQGVAVLIAPPVGQPGRIEFEYNANVPFTGVSATVQLSGSGGFSVYTDAFASPDPTVLECTRNNNRIFFEIVAPKFHIPGARNLQFSVPPSSPENTAPTARLILDAADSGSSNAAARTTVGGFKVYTSTQPNVQPVPGNLLASVPPGQTSLDVGSTPAGSFFVVTAVGGTGESPPSNEVGGVLPTVTKLKVSSSKVVAQGTGFANDVRVLFGGLAFATAPKLKNGNTKVVQKGALITGLSVGVFIDQTLTPGSKMLVYFVNGNGNGVAVEYTK